MNGQKITKEQKSAAEAVYGLASLADYSILRVDTGMD